MIRTLVGIVIFSFIMTASAYLWLRLLAKNVYLAGIFIGNTGIRTVPAVLLLALIGVILWADGLAPRLGALIVSELIVFGYAVLATWWYGNSRKKSS